MYSKPLREALKQKKKIGVFLLIIVAGVSVFGGLVVTDSTTIGSTGGEFQTGEGDSTVVPDDSNLTIDNHDPHVNSPQNDYRLFYSASGGEGDDRQLEDIPVEDLNYGEAGLQSEGEDITYETSTGQYVPVAGNTVGEYRRTQLLQVNNSPDYTYLVHGPEISQRESGNIDNAYIEIVDVNGGSKAAFPEYNDQFEGGYDYITGDNGEVFVYFDFQIDEMFKDRPEDIIGGESDKVKTLPIVTYELDPEDDELPPRADTFDNWKINDVDEIVDEPERIWTEETFRQTQKRKTMVVEDFAVQANVTADGKRVTADGDVATMNYSLGEISSTAREAEVKDESFSLVDEAETDEAYGGLSFTYDDSMNDEIEFTANGEVTTDAVKYHWERERYRVYDTVVDTINGSAKVEGVSASEDVYNTCYNYHCHGCDDGDDGDGGEGSTSPGEVSEPDFNTMGEIGGYFGSRHTCGGTMTQTVPCTSDSQHTRETTETRTRSYYDLPTEHGNYTNHKDDDDDTTYDRNTTITRTRTFNVTDYAHGTCTDTVDKHGSDTVNDNIDDIINEVHTFTFKYDYWDWWNPAHERDAGGYELQNTTMEGNDTVEVSDSIDTINTDVVEPPNVTQEVVQVDGATYHAVIKIEDNDRISSPPSMTSVEAVDAREAYLWSMMTFGPKVAVSNDWRMYSSADEVMATSDLNDEPKPSSAKVEGPEELSSDAQNEVYYSVRDANTSKTDPVINKTRVRAESSPGFPAQLQVKTVPTREGLQIYSSDTRTGERQPKLMGWNGSKYGNIEGPKTDKEDYGIDDTVSINMSDRPVFYDTIVMENAPRPAQSLVSIHGNVYNISESNIKEVTYVEPDAEITYNETSGNGTIEVTGYVGNPLEGHRVTVYGVGGGQEVVTDENGTAEFNISQNLGIIQAEIEGDDINQFVDSVNQSRYPGVTVYYGDVTVQKAISDPWVETTGATLWNVIVRLLWASPLLLFYVFYRDTSLGS